MNQTSARGQRVGGERSSSEVATAGHGLGHDEPESSLVTARNARIPVQRQFRIAGRAFNKSKTRLEKRESDGEQWEVPDRVVHDERVGDSAPAEGRSAAMQLQENGDLTPNILRHLDSGIRITLRLDTDASADIRHPNLPVFSFERCLSASGFIRANRYLHPVHPTGRYPQMPDICICRYYKPAGIECLLTKFNHIQLSKP
ncbi:hypothetical protein K435DRAFT_867563 [Dendrothele bispora CBS 962.96]|uniref:Uncharacterized protein n=1 Tax=Dendrothele bispora (strain CBS 962.96) TaxID=1314807 RepID=A0A4S8LE09_DENBC|nr:hypothetical protein K435DRAFT_867563 [Dendrothele bispora CBS 962.96]